MKRLFKILIITLIICLAVSSFCFGTSALVIYEDDFGFEVNTVKQEATLVGYTGEGGSVIIPEYFQDYPVTVIDNGAFSGNKTITEVTFSRTNTTIEEYAFMDCTSLETVSIPENVVNIGDRAFSGCASLKTVTMLSDIVSMPTNLFFGCTSLSELTLSETIVDFGYGCFNGCSSLTDLGFVSNGAMLDSYAFHGTGARSVVLSDALLAIPNYAFTNCPDLESVTIPESVVLIQPYAFDWGRVTIFCEPDSYAHVFAQENGIRYDFIPSRILGDTDNDRKITILDATCIQRTLASIPVNAYQEEAADVDGDGKISVLDATGIQKWLASLPAPDGINTWLDG